MDPVSIIGVAAASLQFVEFASRLFTTGWRVYKDADGRSVEITSLSIVQQDLARLTKNIDAAVAADPRNVTGTQKDDHALRSLLGEVNDMAEEIKRVVPRASRHFEMLAKTDESEQPETLGGQPNSAPLVGKWFRIALEQVLKAHEIKRLKEDLATLRTRIVQELTASIWVEVRDTNQWEHQFNKKLDEVLSAMNTANRADQLGGPKVDKLLAGKELMDTSPVFRQTATEKQIIRRIWDPSWHFDEPILPTYTEQAPGVIPDLKAQIVETLYYDSIKHREEAIANTFRSTYEWVFSHEKLDSELKESIRRDMSDWLSATDEDKSRLPFWITGKPGSGKSVFMKFIFNHEATANVLQKWAGTGTLHKVGFYAWKPGTDMGKSREGLMRSILYQVLTQDPELTAAVCPRQWTLFHLIRAHPEKKCPAWNEEKLTESLRLLLKEVERRGTKLAVFIDGLDEFVEPPMELCELILELSQSPSIKVCVASRPWSQFRDAFHQCHVTELHLVTKEDMHAYVFGKFEGLPAFQDLNNGYVDGGNRLLRNILERAQGVFLWVTLVTTTIFENLSCGAGFEELQQILNNMPPEIEGLYDAIYDSIPISQRQHAAAMLRIFEAAMHPLHWYPLWLADEVRCDVEELPMSKWIPRRERDRLIPTLRRRITARTRGILEFTQDTGFVECLHRTASEWLKMPHVSDKLRLQSPEGFDPYASLYFSGLITARQDPYSPTRPYRQGLAIALLYGSFADAEHTTTMVRHMLAVHDRAQAGRALLVQAIRHTCCEWGMARFVMCWYKERPRDFAQALSKQESSINMLKAAVTKDALKEARTWHFAVDTPASDIERLRLVEFLLRKARYGWGIQAVVAENLQEAETSQDKQNMQYFRKVEGLLKAHPPNLKDIAWRLLKGPSTF
ncbi:hypothetical protein CC79DRAFT_1394437 [Sarocladium strictum]